MSINNKGQEASKSLENTHEDEFQRLVNRLRELACQNNGAIILYAWMPTGKGKDAFYGCLYCSEFDLFRMRKLLSRPKSLELSAKMLEIGLDGALCDIAKDA